MSVNTWQLIACNIGIYAIMNDKYSFELVHLKSSKFSIGVHSKTSNLATRCDLNRYPISVTILKLNLLNVFTALKGTHFFMFYA